MLVTGQAIHPNKCTFYVLGPQHNKHSFILFNRHTTVFALSGGPQYQMNGSPCFCSTSLIYHVHKS